MLLKCAEAQNMFILNYFTKNAALYKRALFFFFTQMGPYSICLRNASIGKSQHTSKPKRSLNEVALTRGNLSVSVFSYFKGKFGQNFVTSMIHR